MKFKNLLHFLVEEKLITPEELKAFADSENPAHMLQQILEPIFAIPKNNDATNLSSFKNEIYTWLDEQNECASLKEDLQTKSQEPQEEEDTAKSVQPFKKSPVLNETVIVSTTNSPSDSPKKDLSATVIVESSSAMDDTKGEKQIFVAKSISSQEKIEKKGTKDQRYILLETLGKGGMGVVQRVEDIVLGREVALKKIPFDKDLLSEKQKLLALRLQTEASITAQLEHPNIVPLYDMIENDEIYFTMRKVEGKTLGEILAQKKAKRKESALFDENRLLSIILKVCDAVSYAHSRGVIHRDLKPENIMVGQFGEVYVVDWGIAKIAQANSEEKANSELTEKNKFSAIGVQTIGGIGTPGYMAPEQQKDASSITAKADIYSLGKILKECFTYVSPIEEMKLLSHLEEEGVLENKAKKWNRIPKDIQAIVSKATAEKETQRYGTVQNLIMDIERYQKNLSISARDFSYFEVLQKWYLRNRIRILSTSMFIGLFLTFMGYIFWENWFQEKLEQEKWRQSFNQFYLQAKFERKRASKISNEGNANQTKKIESLLLALNHSNRALKLIPHHYRVEQEKYRIGMKLILLCFETKNYHLANFVAENMKDLNLLLPEEKQKLLKNVEEKRTKTLKEHQEILESWIDRFLTGNIPIGAREDAIFELSQMQEKEVFERLMQLFLDGSKYFLQATKREVRKEELYLVITNVIGRLHNSNATPILLNTLKEIHQRVVLQFQHKTQAGFEHYMVTLIEALANLKAFEAAKYIEELRWALGSNRLFGKLTKISYLKIIKGTIQNLTKSIELDGTNAKAYNRRGAAKKVQGEYLAAIEDFSKAIELDPSNPDFFSNRGLAKKSIKQYQKAIADFSKAIALDTNYDGAYNNRGLAKRCLGDFEGALADYTKAITLNPESSLAYNNRGTLKRKLGDFKGAIEDFSEAISIDPHFAVAYNNRGNAKLFLKDYRAAILDYEHSLQLNPHSFETYHNSGGAKKLLGLHREAILDFTKAIQFNSFYTNAFFERGITKFETEDLKGALQDFTEVLRLNSEDPKGYYYRGRVRQAMKQYHKACLDYKAALRLDPKYFEVYLNRGICKRNLDDLSGALLDYDQAILLNPNSSLAFYNRGLAKEYQQDLTAARIDYLEAIRLNPKYTKAYLSLADLSKKGNSFEKAIEYCSKVLQFDPKNAKVYPILAFSKNAIQDHQGALVAYDKAIQFDSENEEHYQNRGLIKDQLNDYQGAIQDYDKAILLTPNNANAYNNRANTKSKIRDLKGAFKDYTMAIKLNSSYALAYQNRAGLYINSENYKAAILDLGKVIEFQPKNYTAFYHLGYSYQKQNQREQAIEFYEKGLALNKENKVFAKFFADLVLQRGIEFYQKKSFKKAKEDLLRFEKYAPPNHSHRKIIKESLKRIEERIVESQK